MGGKCSVTQRHQAYIVGAAYSRVDRTRRPARLGVYLPGACFDPRYVRASYHGKSSRPPCIVCVYVESYFGPTPPASYARRQTGLCLEVRLVSYPERPRPLRTGPGQELMATRPPFFQFKNQILVSAENQTKPCRKRAVSRIVSKVLESAIPRRRKTRFFSRRIRHLLSESVTVGDFHQLLQLLCHDFPRAPLDACVHALPRALVGEGRAKCSHLASAFEVHWFYAPFFAALEPAFRGVGRQDSSTTCSSASGEPVSEKAVLKNPLRKRRVGGRSGVSAAVASTGPKDGPSDGRSAVLSTGPRSL
ncbi:hypothetical protein M885DRAFT_135929 [Pelagophyceae sp. CCMP2097]|nr:hypothetical protein M885DRAFT_135929 [Pelagophyceae sp. CCMP2097]